MSAAGGTTTGQHVQLDRARRGVVERYAHLADEATVEACFDAVVREFSSAPVRQYVPVLAERRLREVFTPA